LSLKGTSIFILIAAILVIGGDQFVRASPVSIVSAKALGVALDRGIEWYGVERHELFLDCGFFPEEVSVVIRNLGDETEYVRIEPISSHVEEDRDLSKPYELISDIPITITHVSQFGDIASLVIWVSNRDGSYEWRIDPSICKE
jgi:hypothetical protein